MCLLARGRTVRVALIVLTACVAARPVIARSDESPPADAGIQAIYSGDAAVGSPTVPIFADTTSIVGVPDTNRVRALDCMSWAIAYEAAGQPIAGQEAVGQVILNRVRDPHRPKTVCGVVFQGSERRTGCQFTFTCDGSLHRRLSDSTMTIARRVAEQVLDGIALDHVRGATNYHANYVSPLWAATGRRVARIGAHIFYQMPGLPVRASGPVATLGEPEFAAPPSPAPSRRFARADRLGPPQQTAQTAASHASFQPWGLPVVSALRQ